MAGKIDTRGATFRDAHGRHVLLRGVNFGGDCKVPASPDGRTYRPSRFDDHRTVSFVGRPAELSELNEHLGRLRHWGFNCLRLLVTWEAVEHAGPGQYDEAFLDYYVEVCRRAGAHGLHVFIDFHQDAWSRMSGGDGAPGWTWEAIGMDFTAFPRSGAAHLMQHEYDPTVGGRQDAYPVMSWSGNYARPANGVMWTLFFGGQDFAPAMMIDGRNVQTWLQDHYFGAVGAVAERVAHLDNVIGFDTLNEPGTGYIGKALTGPIVRYRGPIWTALDGLALASGEARELPVVAPGQGVVGRQVLNTEGLSIWMPGRGDPFRAAGVWDLRDGVAVALKEDYFQVVDGRAVDLGRDYMAPFFGRVAETVRAIRPDWLIFGEVDPFEAVMGHGFPEGSPERMVNASHWYDLTALVTKRFTPDRMTHVWTGQVREGGKAIEDGYVEEMSMLVAAGKTLSGGAPTLLGECGIQYDMNEADAYRRWSAGNRDPEVWSAQTVALSLMYNAIDRLLLSSTQWNYTVSNRNDPMIGDGWNQEDLSIWSRDQAGGEGFDAGGRAIDGFCRPYVRAAQGTILRQAYDLETGLFKAEIDVDLSITQPTEIYVPQRRYSTAPEVTTEGGSSEVVAQVLNVKATRAGRQTIRVTAR